MPIYHVTCVVPSCTCCSWARGKGGFGSFTFALLCLTTLGAIVGLPLWACALARLRACACLFLACLLVTAPALVLCFCWACVLRIVGFAIAQPLQPLCKPIRGLLGLGGWGWAVVGLLAVYPNYSYIAPKFKGLCIGGKAPLLGLYLCRCSIKCS